MGEGINWQEWVIFFLLQYLSYKNITKGGMGKRGNGGN